jgi:hypothetical protein
MSEPTVEHLEEQYDSPLERLQLLGEDDAAIAAFLDEIDVRSARDREMLRELARSSSLARPDRFESDHRRVLVGLESLRRHGHQGQVRAHSCCCFACRSVSSSSSSRGTSSSRT